jgi:hypothetical protein
VTTKQDQRDRLLKSIHAAWTAFMESHEGLSDAELIEAGVVGAWSVKDIMAHLTVWENEALTHLPQIAQGRRPPTYAIAHGGIDAFNAKMEQRWEDFSLAEVHEELDETHARLIAYLRSVPPELLDSRSRFRRRLRLDTYGHYPIHTEHIRAWRSRKTTGA